MALVMEKMGTQRAQMGRSMAHIAHQPGPVCVEGGVSRRWGWHEGAGRGGEFGGGTAPAPTRGAWGASSIRVPKKNARCPGPPALRRSEGLAGMAELRRLFPGGGMRSKAAALPQFTGLFNVQEENHSCARDQVVIARPPVLTPRRRYRLSLVSRGLFTISINVICVGIRSSPPKRRKTTGDPLRPRGKAGCRLFRGS
jgi:hypothetical protein